MAIDRRRHLRLDDLGQGLPAKRTIALAPIQPICLHGLHHLEGSRQTVNRRGALWHGVLLCRVLVDRREYPFTHLTQNLLRHPAADVLKYVARGACGTMTTPKGYGSLMQM